MAFIQDVLKPRHSTSNFEYSDDERSDMAETQQDSEEEELEVK